MVKAKEPDIAVAAFIRDHVRIVMISKEECERLDRRGAFKQRMPESWKIGGDIFARLEAAEIAWSPKAD